MSSTHYNLSLTPVGAGTARLNVKCLINGNAYLLGTISVTAFRYPSEQDTLERRINGHPPYNIWGYNLQTENGIKDWVVSVTGISFSGLQTKFIQTWDGHGLYISNLRKPYTIRVEDYDLRLDVDRKKVLTGLIHELAAYRICVDHGVNKPVDAQGSTYISGAHDYSLFMEMKYQCYTGQAQDVFYANTASTSGRVRNWPYFLNVYNNFYLQGEWINALVSFDPKWTRPLRVLTLVNVPIHGAK